MSRAKQLTLYGHAGFRSFRNVWMLEELGVPYTHLEVRPQSAEAKRVNPFGKIPALETGDGFVMYESSAINTYLGDCFRSELVPVSGTQLRGRYEQVVACIVAEVDSQGLWIHRKHEALGHIFGAIPQAVVAARLNFERAIGVLKAELGERGDYILGNRFTAADVLLVHCVDWATSIGWMVADESEARKEDDQWWRYVRRCRAREAYQRALAKK